MQRIGKPKPVNTGGAADNVDLLYSGVKSIIMAYERKAIYEDIHGFLANVEMHHTKSDIVYLDGDPIKLGSDRYKTFKVKGTDCVYCGAKGIYLAKERTKTVRKPLYETWHLNLYARRIDGTVVLMTKDHIVPKSKGGLDLIENYQPMCETCNSQKGSKYEEG